LGLLEKGVTLGLIKQYTEALECFHEVLIKDPENPDALHFKEITLEYMNQEEKVVK
jgi:tetratricopeptide (TPR) repeat protein